MKWLVIASMIFRMRLSWYRHRRSEKHPISLWRAMFGRHPRFGSYEENEPGCPDWAKRDYAIVEGPYVR